MIECIVTCLTLQEDSETHDFNVYDYSDLSINASQLCVLGVLVSWPSPPGETLVFMVDISTDGVEVDQPTTRFVPITGFF